MSSTMEVTRTRLQRLIDERGFTIRKHEDVVGEAEKEERDLTDDERNSVKHYRERAVALDAEIEELSSDLERAEKSEAASKQLRTRSRVGNGDGRPAVIGEDGQTHYRSFAVWARDELIVRYPQIANRAGGDDVRKGAAERLMRAPAHTLTADIEGLLPPQHIAQIIDVINKNRPVVNTARRLNLTNGKITWPRIAGRPTVAKQATEKTETASTKMDVTLEETLADTYLGAGNLSWQAINWSSPDALSLWFDLAAEAYAKATEAAACNAIDAAAVVSTPALAGDGTDTFAEWLAAAIGGMAAVYGATEAAPDTLYLSPDMFFYAAGVTSDAGAMLVNAGQLNLAGMSGTIGGLRVVTSPGLPVKTAIVGDSQAFLVAETGGAPVELRAVEPAIGGMEVGVIGAFKAIVFDADRFREIGVAGTA